MHREYNLTCSNFVQADHAHNVVSLRHRLYWWRTKDAMSSCRRWHSHRFTPVWDLAERCCTYSAGFNLRARHMTGNSSPTMFLGQITSARRLWETTWPADIMFDTVATHLPSLELGRPTLSTYSWLMSYRDLLLISECCEKVWTTMPWQRRWSTSVLKALKTSSSVRCEDLSCNNGRLTVKELKELAVRDLCVSGKPNVFNSRFYVMPLDAMLAKLTYLNC